MERESLSAVGERHRSKTRRIDRHEEIKAQSNGGDLGVTRFVAKLEYSTSEEEACCHEWEGNQKEISASKGINGVNCRDGEEEVDDAATHGDEEGLRKAVVGIGENGSRVICDHIYATELLHELSIILAKF
jgi:hypothetical protein